ncbi:FMN reductase [Marinicaulis flavus]|uniref:FMN reductase n=2 Tax=Hyphococcus luteus TaxID=2058213 RepID=A0A2S7K546_9PROT|nr:FMN reductase [Marinicaulis flavus]
MGVQDFFGGLVEDDAPHGEIHVVGLGGALNEGSSSERLLRYALERCAERGANTSIFTGGDLDLPIYAPFNDERTDKAKRMIEALRAANGIILCSPCYHGTVSGLIKNAIDYVQDMYKDEAPYFEGRAVGLIAAAGGWQATGSTLATLRAITHSLRGWPTPMAVAVNTSLPVFDEAKTIVDEQVKTQLDIMAEQVVTFAGMSARR